MQKDGIVQTYQFAELKRLKHRIATQLCKRGILQVAEDKVFLFFTRKVYPEINPEPEKALIERLRKAIFTNTTDIDPRTVILLSLANSAGLLKLVFDRGELKSRKARIEQIVNGEMVGEGAKEAIEAMETALVISKSLRVRSSLQQVAVNVRPTDRSLVFLWRRSKGLISE